MRKASAIELDEAQREKLVRLAHSNTTEVRLARRASIVLLAADGLDNHRIGEMLGVGRIQAGRWRDRYAADGLKAIEQDLPRGGRILPTVCCKPAAPAPCVQAIRAGREEPDRASFQAPTRSATVRYGRDGR